MLEWFCYLLCRTFHLELQWLIIGIKTNSRSIPKIVTRYFHFSTRELVAEWSIFVWLSSVWITQLDNIQHLYWIYNGNRTKWSQLTKSNEREAGVWFVNHKYDYRQNWTRRSSPFQFQKKTNTPRTNISSGDNVFCLKFLHFGNSLGFLWTSGCYYGHYDHFCDLWISWVDLVRLATSNVRLQPTVQ